MVRDALQAQPGARDLQQGARDEIRARVRDMQRRRSESQPRKARTFGSVFKNPGEGPGAGQLLEACGLKGHVIGGAQISPVHANFIENLGDATSKDVAALVQMLIERGFIHLDARVELAHSVS